MKNSCFVSQKKMTAASEMQIDAVNGRNLLGTQLRMRASK
jgi:hypothetical protein